MTSLGTRMYFIYVGYNVGYKQTHSKILLSTFFRNVGIFKLTDICIDIN